MICLYMDSPPTSCPLKHETPVRRKRFINMDVVITNWYYGYCHSKKNKGTGTDDEGPLFFSLNQTYWRKTYWNYNCIWLMKIKSSYDMSQVLFWYTSVSWDNFILGKEAIKCGPADTQKPGGLCLISACPGQGVIDAFNIQLFGRPAWRMDALPVFQLRG